MYKTVPYKNQRSVSVRWIRSMKSTIDISFEIRYLASKLENATIEVIKFCNKITSKVTSDSYKLNYQKINGNLKLVLYTAA